MFKQQHLTLLLLILFNTTMLVHASDRSLDIMAMTLPPVQDSASLLHPIDNQKPHATVLTCSDSPIHTNMLDKIPATHLFMISNLGNQLTTSLGSVTYGVNYLGSPLLLIIGHSNCEAIHTANSDYSHLESILTKELSTIHVIKGSSNSESAKTNVNNQVAIALTAFASKVKNGELLVVGAVYELNDETQQTTGKLNIININGETDPDKLNNIATTVAQAT